MKKLLSILLVLCMLFSFNGVCVFADDTKVYTAESSISLSDIKETWEELKPSYSGDTYLVKPSASVPYEAGKLTDGIVKDGLNMANFVRYIAHLPADLEIDADLQSKAQHGAVLLNRIGQLNHTPEQPEDMPKDFYDEARYATSRSNISAGSVNLYTSILMYMSDSDAKNISKVGHRQWMLSPMLKKTGFGLSDFYSAMYVFDSSRSKGVNNDFICWPAYGNMPTELFKQNDAWSVSLDAGKFAVPNKEDVTVTMTNQDGDVTTFSQSDSNTSGKYFNVGESGMGMGCCIIFRPMLKYKDGDKYKIEIDGLKDIKTGAPVKIMYNTEFFDLEKKIETEIKDVNPELKIKDVNPELKINDETDIKVKYEQLKQKYNYMQYKSQPLLTAPYKAGEISAGNVTDAVNTLKFIRYLGGITEEIPNISDELTVASQHLAVKLGVNKDPSNYTKPADMSDEFDKKAFRKTPRHLTCVGGVNATLADNIQRTVMCNPDFRTEMLLPGMMSGIGFGHVPGSFSVVETFAKAKLSENQLNTIAWPNAGDNPVEFVDPSWVWVVVLNSSLYDYKKLSGYKVTVTGADGEQKPLAYDVNSCFPSTFGAFSVSFYPKMPKNGVKPGDSFKVKIENIYKIGAAKPCTLEYTVNFFSLDPAYFIKHPDKATSTTTTKPETTTTPTTTKPETTTTPATTKPETTAKPETTTTPTTTTTEPTTKPETTVTSKKSDDGYLNGTSSWAKSEVKKAKEGGLTINNVLSDYQKNITREEFCKLVVKFYKAMGGEIPEIGKSPFADTSDEDILIANKLGIVNGVSETEFSSNSDITREQLSAMVMRAMSKFCRPKIVNNIDRFKDYNKISTWARDSLSYLNQLNIVKGVSDTEIAPLNNTTREQAILIIYRTFSSFLTDAGIEEGIYRIIPSVNEKSCVRISAGSKDDGANAIEWERTDSKSQTFSIRRSGDKYIIESCNSKMILTATDRQVNGTNIIQTVFSNADNQMFDIVDAGDGFVNIVSSNGYYVSASAGKPDNGTKIILWEMTGNASQKFILEKQN